ncbi:GNAT family N-acetyltransferase [Alkalibacterium olivapovliticus]|uniref:Diamine N-acetyltransferase n=1 Tax=Alkalibacterium olivapovliticus TaxID=99907 RepID=A0A2T0W8B7_9LACT|nr:GNAT family N-acetyltransferase [Alkalibacterium olivapovliticus]PRY82940.1 diamine N-acetyltransferase [Alkalibacterium olivapovliticus]
MNKITLTPVEKDDTDYLLDLFKNPDVMDYWFSEPYMNKEKYTSSFENRQKDESARQFIAYAEEVRIGYTNLHLINLRHRTAVLAIMLDPDNQGKGYAEKVVRSIVDYGFNQLNLNKITLDVVDYNEKAVHIYEKVGFKIEGKKEQQYFIQGKYHTSLSMGLLREHYQK